MGISDSKIRAMAIIILTLSTAAICAILGLSTNQLISTTIFAFKTYATLLFWRFRLPFAFIGIFALLALGVLDIPHLIEFAGFDIILFLIGMMTVIGFLEEKHFFEYLIDKILGIVGSKPEGLVLVLMGASALFAALVDEVTSILFMSAAVLQLTSLYGLEALPFIMMIVFATNIGSSATVVGNPVAVMIALKAGITFTDFVRWATPISILALVVTMLLSRRLFSKDIKRLGEAMKHARSHSKDEGEEEGSKPINQRDVKVAWIVFLGTIASLALHHQIEELLHLERNTMLIGTALTSAGIVLLIERERARELIERRVDWWTLTFFTLLFASVGTLKYVGTTELLARALHQVSGGSELSILLLFSSVAAVLSAFMDNVLAVATFIPIVHDLGSMGVYNFPLWWGLLFAGTFFGNLTMIGSTANIVAIGMVERRGRGHITFTQWLKAGAVIAIPTLATAIILLYLQLPMMPR
jgi:Na+/H+ antiporter NhaD/arsenite permease-like protein